MDLLEQVQSRVTKITRDLEHLTYKDGMGQLRLCGVSQVLGRPYGNLPVLKGGLKHRWGQIFLSGPIVIGLMDLKGLWF